MKTFMIGFNMRIFLSMSLFMILATSLSVHAETTWGIHYILGKGQLFDITAFPGKSRKWIINHARKQLNKRMNYITKNIKTSKYVRKSERVIAVGIYKSHFYTPNAEGQSWQLECVVGNPGYGVPCTDAQ